ncbi:hypothetical protein [Maritimibacter sp. DP1N21-5]|uniref:hypothetical protein n=1 Tax=Maritimibacter sp. DP1N21-5 TaxID=2836867 RepID=UPI001C47246D|nr:hypothetical protein [Maritimibacter sp. DP1N21-5]MBV7408761.1 hypothetical protein [Maritimibacter sp. DP1N21-5]
MGRYIKKVNAGDQINIGAIELTIKRTRSSRFILSINAPPSHKIVYLPGGDGWVDDNIKETETEPRIEAQVKPADQPPE